MRTDSFGWQISKLLFSKSKEKLSKFRDPHWLALIFVEFFLTLVLVGAILLYLDGRFNQIEYPFNLFIFGLIFYGVYYFYGHTASYRNTRTPALKRNSNTKTLLLELVLFLIILFSAYLYKDPTVNLLPYPLNILIFIAVLSIPLYFYIEEKFVKA